MTDLILDVDDLSVYFQGSRRQAPIRAVDGVSFGIGRGETLGLIGESGSGKSTIGRAVLGLLDPRSGTVRIGGDEVWKLGRRAQRQARSRVQVVFQDPSEALDPRMTVGASIREPLRIRDGRRRPEHDAVVERLLVQVGLDPAHASRHPHELSGGQKQRVNIARALVLDPELIVCDEVVSALDVSIQAEILNLFAELKRDRDLAYLFISHDLSVVAHVADRIAVMYLGVLMELGPVEQIVGNPQHPYTRALLAAQPQAVPSRLRRPKPPPLVGDIPSPADPPSGCRFRTRCPMAVDRCAEEVPTFAPSAPGHWVACHFAGTVTDLRDAPALVTSHPNLDPPTPTTTTWRAE